MSSGEVNAPKHQAICVADMFARRRGGERAHLGMVDDVMDVLDISCPRRGSQPPLWVSLTREIPLDVTDILGQARVRVDVTYRCASRPTPATMARLISAELDRNEIWD